MATIFIRATCMVLILQFLFIQKGIGQNTKNQQTEQKLKDQREDITNQNYLRERNKQQTYIPKTQSTSTGNNSGSSRDASDNSVYKNSIIPTKKYGEMKVYIETGYEPGVKTGYLISYTPKIQIQPWYGIYLASLNEFTKVWQIISVSTSGNAKKTSYGVYYGSSMGIRIKEEDLKIYYDPKKSLTKEDKLAALEKYLAGEKPPTKDATIIKPVSVPVEMPAERAKWNYKGLSKFSEVVFKTAIKNPGEFSWYYSGYLVDSLESNNAYGKIIADYAITPQYESDSIFFYHIYNTSTSYFQGENTGSLFKIISAKSAGVRVLSYGQAYTKEELAKLEIKLKQTIEQKDKLTFEYKRKADENKNYIGGIKNAAPSTLVKFLVLRQTSWSRMEQSWSYEWEPTNAYKLNIAAKDSFFVAEDCRGKGLDYSWKIYLFDLRYEFSGASTGEIRVSFLIIKETELPTGNSRPVDVLENISTRVSQFIRKEL